MRFGGGKSTLGVASLTLLALWAGCSNDSQDGTSQQGTVKDTLGTQFTVSCSASFCSLTPADPTLDPSTGNGAVSCSAVDGVDMFLLLPGRILTAHLMSTTSGGSVVLNAADPSHPIACAVDADCAPGNLMTGRHSYAYACIVGICQDPTVGLYPEDVIALCQADIPWPRMCPYITTQPLASRLDEIGTLCAGQASCTKIPSDCRQIAPMPDGGTGGAGDAAEAAQVPETSDVAPPVDLAATPSPDGGAGID
jgi:hypothetical protein